MIKALQVLTFIFLFSLIEVTEVKSNNSIYLVKTNSEGVFKFKSPFSKNSRILFENDTDCYVVTPTSDEMIYFYSTVANSFLIRAISGDCPCGIISSFPKEEVHRKRNKYKNSVRQATDNWFHALVNKKVDFDFYQRNQNFNGKTKVTLKLYNFNEKFINSFFSIGEEMHKIKLAPFEEKMVSYDINLAKNELKFKIFSNNNIGIKSVAISNSNKIISKIANLEFFAPPFEVLDDSKESLYFYFDDYELKKTKNINDVMRKSILAIKERFIQNATLKVVETISGFLEETVIIYHELFESEILKLENLLKKKGLRSFSINAQKIYNNFGSSSKSAESIKKFLIANNVKRCIIVGDGHADETSNQNLVPSFVYITRDGNRILSDYYFSYEEHPLKPSIEVSRLPFRNINELSNYILKVDKTSFATQADPLVLSNAKIVYEKSTKPTYKFNANNLDDIINEKKPSLIYHMGHGNELAWQGEKLIKEGSFKNVQIQYDLVDFSCWTGAFGLRKFDSLSESLLKMVNGGPTSIVSSYGPLKLGRMNSLFDAYDNISKRDNLSKRHLKAKKWLSLNYPGFIDELYSLNLFGLGI